MNDWYQAGCHRTCSTLHTYRHGMCAHSHETPEPQITLLRRGQNPGDIVSLTYNTRELADVIAPALRGVRITLGPNSLAALKNGNILTLSGGEIDALALEAAHAIIEDIR